LLYRFVEKLCDIYRVKILSYFFVDFYYFLSILE
jgi:hypothetical protein